MADPREAPHPAPVTPAQAAVAAYNERVAADPGAAVAQHEWLQDAFRSAGITFGGSAMPTCLRPHFIDVEDWRRLRQSARRVVEIAARVARRVFDGDVDRLCAHLGIPEERARLLRVDPGEPDVVYSRVDAFPTADGPRFIEINSDAPAGFGYGDSMANVFARLPLFRTFAKEKSVHYQRSAGVLVDAFASLWRRRGGRGVPNVAVLDWTDVKARPDQEILSKVFKARGARCVVADMRDVEIRRERLYCGEMPVDVVFRRGVSWEIAPRADELMAFLTAYERGLALFINTFRCNLSEDKGFFAILTDESWAHLLSEEERDLVLRCLPWTRRLEDRKTLWHAREVDLVPHVLAHRRDFVLKPTEGYGGEAVVVGDQVTEAEWLAAVETALRRPTVVQERVEIPEERFPMVIDGDLRFESLKLNTNPFYVSGGEVGAITRLSREAVINISAGGGAVPTYVVA